MDCSQVEIGSPSFMYDQITSLSVPTGCAEDPLPSPEAGADDGVEDVPPPQPANSVTIIAIARKNAIRFFIS
jgi:hypothetical protein